MEICLHYCQDELKASLLLKLVIETGAQFSGFRILVKNCFYMTAMLEI